MFESHGDFMTVPHHPSWPDLVEVALPLTAGMATPIVICFILKKIFKLEYLKNNFKKYFLKNDLCASNYKIYIRMISW